MKINRLNSHLNITKRIRLRNASELFSSKSGYASRIRGNERTILLRVLHDFVNAHNKGRKGTYEQYKANKLRLPAIVERNGQQWLYTAPALIEQAEDFAFTAQTASNWLKVWAERIKKNAQEGAETRKLPFINAVSWEGNDIAIALETGFFEMEEPKPHPHKPPDAQGKADSAQEGTLTQDQILRAAAKFNRKHHAN